jgi:hypothetical protein
MQVFAKKNLNTIASITTNTEKKAALLLVNGTMQTEKEHCEASAFGTLKTAISTIQRSARGGKPTNRARMPLSVVGVKSIGKSILNQIGNGG